MSANALTSLTRAVQPEAAKKAAGQAKEMKRLREASEDFESLFVTQMYQAMRKTAPSTQLFGSTRDEELFRGMLDQEVAKQAAHGHNFGLGESLYQQMAGTLMNEPGRVPTIVTSGKPDTNPKGH